LLIYCEYITPRITFAFKVIFECVCKVDYKITDNRNDFLEYDGAKINYSKSSQSTGLHIIPSDIMFSQEIRQWEISHGEYNNHAVLFLHDKKTDLPYDPIAAIFFMVSRYEEYLPFQADKHDRFPLEANLSYQLGFHAIPIVHYWVKDLTDIIQKKFPQFSLNENKYAFRPTFDIDNAYAFMHKDPVRTYGGILKSLFTDIKQLKLRLDVLKGKAKDPYDTYDYIQKFSDQYNVRPIFFILTASGNKYDTNINPVSSAFKGLISNLSYSGKIGIHPSYASNKIEENLEKEINLLRDMLKKNVHNSRQHYLMLRFPETYERLIKNEIINDFSMGFVESPGFRAGMAVRFPFYNLKNENETDLLIHPFAFMESSFMYYRKENLEDVKTKLTSVIKEVKKVNGEFISIWHNESLGDWDKWKDWKIVFELMYKEATE